MEKQMTKYAVVVLGLAVIAPLNGFSQWVTQRFGNGFITQGGYGTKPIVTMPFGNGWITRGTDGSILFASDEFAKQFSEENWVDAVETRNVQEMISCAWDLKRVEAILGRKDTKTTSGALFEAAAQIAVGQRNSESLEQIIALAPECAKYRDELKAAGETRGGIALYRATPELVYPDFPVLMPDAQGQEIWRNALNTLKPFQTPYLRPDMVLLNFRGMSFPSAESVTFLLNKGRTANDAKLIVQGAISLAGQPESSADSIFNPMNIMNEAAELAILTGDRVALSLAVDVFKSNAYGLQSLEQAALYGEELKLLGETRGLRNFGGGTVSLEALLRPPYRLDLLTPESLGKIPSMRF